MNVIERVFGRRGAVIGMVHLLPLPGAPTARGMQEVRERALADARALVAGGVDGLLVENFGDWPFYRDAVPPVTVAAMAVVLAELLHRFGPIPVGVNVLRNDALAALGLAVACGATFIRVNVLTGAMVTDQGVVEGRAAELLRARHALEAGGVAIFADVLVKHAAPLAPISMHRAVLDALERGGADGVVVSGAGTGSPASLDALQQAREAAHGRPVLVGSGVTLGSVREVLRLADAVIVGTAVKAGGDVRAQVDEVRVRALVTGARGA